MATSTNILILDDQHDILYENIARLEHAMGEGRGTDCAPEVLEALTEYSSFHFGTEERLMRSFEYPLRDTHAAQHQGFRRYLDFMREAFARGDKTAALTLLDLLKTWQREHVEGADAMMSEYLVSRGVK